MTLDGHLENILPFLALTLKLSYILCEFVIKAISYPDPCVLLLRMLSEPKAEPFVFFVEHAQ